MSAIYQFKLCARCNRATQFDIHRDHMVCRVCGGRDRPAVPPVRLGLAMIVGLVVIVLAWSSRT